MLRLYEDFYCNHTLRNFIFSDKTNHIFHLYIYLKDYYIFMFNLCFE